MEGASLLQRTILHQLMRGYGDYLVLKVELNNFFTQAFFLRVTFYMRVQSLSLLINCSDHKSHTSS